MISDTTNKRKDLEMRDKLLKTGLVLCSILSASLSVYANTCKECDRTFWPKEGENGRLCPSCVSAKNFRETVQFLKEVADENEKAKEEERKAEEKRAARTVASRDEYNESHYRWQIYCRSTNNGPYSFKIQEKDNRPLYGWIKKRSDYDKDHFVPRDSQILQNWIAINEDNSNGKSREFSLPKRYKEENKRLNIIIKDGHDNWYCVKNLKIYYDNSEDVLNRMTMTVKPVSGGIKVKVFAGGSWDEDTATMVVNTTIETSSDPNKYKSVIAE